MKYWIGARVRLSEACRGRLMQTATETEHVRVATENRTGVVIQ
ncbi:MAG TPA: hypothetical protein VFI11_09645 [Anaerolineales bacterium]|nr:hypothetical protein [Anaerolineales bacterium]